MTKFARRMDRVEMSGIRRIFDLARQMTDAVDLSLGQPDFDVPGPIKRAMIEAIERGYNRYTVTQGMPELIEGLRRHLQRDSGFKDGGILVTAGTAGGLFQALAVLVEDGDEVVVPDPYFALYYHLVNFFGGKPVLLDTYPDFRIRPEKLEALLTPRTRVIVFNNPVNPTGVAYRPDEVAAICDVAKRHEVLLLSDEIYSAFSYDFPHESVLKHDGNALLVGGFSKTFAVTGWRLGFAAGPRDIIEKMAVLQQFSFVCANAPGQRAAITALDVDVSAYVDAYRKKRDFVVAALKDRFDFVRPQGAFYVFPKCPWGDDEAFVRKAIENKLLIVPGRATSKRTSHFRLSFAVSDRQLERAVEILNKLADQNRA
ncbi:MAG: aminotransferase class I/II-fold pyridoxal phosphate-dependent enzyme [Planctomycetes bacterium]|nr:aminotransferase class I/II-fold pyridoxal phosphate-dependent enzyme [Planctomycetota bacterium]